jgi:hypothetical protein
MSGLVLLGEEVIPVDKSTPKDKKHMLVGFKREKLCMYRYSAATSEILFI